MGQEEEVSPLIISRLISTYMSRAKVFKNQQKRFLNRVFKHSGCNWHQIARTIGISERTLCDWRNERYNIRYDALIKLHEISKVPLPKVSMVLPEYWSVKKAAYLGGLSRQRLYGNFGTSNGRRLGGIRSQSKFRLDPEYAENLGIRVRKEIKKPERSKELAEFVGMMLGDGGMSDYQASVTLNSKTDREYSVFARNLIYKLFGVKASVVFRKGENTVSVTASSINLIAFLEKNGLRRGNKVSNQVAIPSWITANRLYSIACLRGLMDTDGSFYAYTNIVNAKPYHNFALCFTNRSKPLIEGVFGVLSKLGLSPYLGRDRVYLYKKAQVLNYLKIIGSHNPKHLNSYKAHVNSR